MSGADQDVARLLSEAEGIDAEHGTASTAPPDPDAPGATPPPTTAQNLSGLLTVITGIAAPFFPSLAAIYTPNNIRQVAQTCAALIDKHGWQSFFSVSRYAEEFAAAAVLIPLAIGTAKAIQHDLAQRQADLAPAPPGQTTDTENQPAAPGLSA